MAGNLVTVVGGTGFLGRAVVGRLLETGWHVRVAARHVPAGEAGRVHPFAVDITDRAAVSGAVAGAHAVVNAVSLYSERDGATFEGVHVEAAGRLARAAREAGVEQFIHVSGIGSHPGSPSRYVAARGRGEQAVRGSFPGAAIVRPSVLFGRDDSFLSTLDAVTRLPVVPLFGLGGNRLQPVHVDDVAAAVVRIVERPDAPARLFEFGGAEVLSYRFILERVLAYRGRWRPLLPIPFAAWHLLAAVCSVLPTPPLTRDQIILMERDNVVGEGVAGFGELGIEPRGLSSALADCLPGRRRDAGGD